MCCKRLNGKCQFTVKTVLLKGGFVVTPKGVVRTDIVLCDDKIKLNSSQAQYDEVTDITGKYVVPGFVDIHFHGYNLFEFTAGLYDPKTKTYNSTAEAYQQGFDMLSSKLAQFGVTSFYIATWAAPIETLNHCYSQLANYLSKTKSHTAGAHLLGGNIEGTFSNPEMAGAQNPKQIFEPSKQVFDSIEDRGTIKFANVVPDFGKKSCQLIEYLTEKGITIGFGHTNATCNQVADAIRAGLKYCVHFTNGPTGGSYKPFNGGGAIEAVLKFDELYAELICDGFHINPAYIRDIVKRKGTGKILGVTDAIFIAGSDLKEFHISGIPGTVSDDGNYIHVAEKPETLFSSNLTMNRGFNNLLNWLTSDIQGIWNRMHRAMNLEEALVTAAKIFSTNPCALTGLEKQGFGAVTEGAKADLCILDITGSPGDYKLTVESTIIDGNTVYSAK